LLLIDKKTQLLFSAKFSLRLNYIYDISDTKQLMIRILLLIFAITVSLGCFSTPQINLSNNQSTKAQKPPILWTADWNPNGKYYAIGGDDRVLRIFNAQEHKLLIPYTLTIPFFSKFFLRR
jgi:WD40 repeat protein